MPEGERAGLAADTWLAFDFGLGRIGVAVGQTATRTATPLVTLRHGGAPDWPAIERLVADWQPSGFVVGLPLDAAGLETDMSRQARRFGEALRNRFGCPVHYSDERLTSRAAQAAFAELRASGKARRKDAARIDAMAAAIILENWLQSRPDQARDG